ATNRPPPWPPTWARAGWWRRPAQKGPPSKSQRQERRSPSGTRGDRKKCCYELSCSPPAQAAAARFTAATMRLWVPQRQRLSASAARMSASLGLFFFANSAAEVMIIPLTQYPHCAACSSMKACCSFDGLVLVPSPSSVVTARFERASIGKPQERTASPAT